MPRKVLAALVAAVVPAGLAVAQEPVVTPPPPPAFTVPQYPVMPACVVPQRRYVDYVERVYRRDTVEKAARVRLMHMRQCAKSRKALRNMWKAHHQARRARALRGVGFPMTAEERAWLKDLKQCESGNDYRINTGNGFYGAVQWTIGTWQSIGGRGMPHLASPAEQDMRTIMLRRRDGTGPWPTCG